MPATITLSLQFGFNSKRDSYTPPVRRRAPVVSEYPTAQCTDDLHLVCYPCMAEPKKDGWRLVAEIDGEGVVNLFSRTGKPLVNFPRIKAAVEALGLRSTVLDGEVHGESLSAVMRVARSKSASDEGLTYTVFDMLTVSEFRGRCNRPQRERRAALEAAVVESRHLALCPSRMVYSAAEADAYFKKIVAAGGEGVVYKDPGATYGTGWYRRKREQTQDGAIVGFVEGQGALRGTLGALVVNINGLLVRVGTGTGLDNETRREIWGDQGRFKGMVVEVGSQERTGRSLRHPRFIRFREDKQ